MAVVVGNAFSLNMLQDSEGTIAFRKLSQEEVKQLLQEGFVSAVGHEDTARVLSNMLGVDIPANRTNVVLDEDTTLVVAQYRGPRLPEGTTKLPEGATIEFYAVALEAPEAKVARERDTSIGLSL